MVKNDRQSRNKKRCCKVRVGVWEDEWLSIGTTKLQRSQIDFFGRCWLFPCFQPAFALLRTLMFLLMVKVTYNAFLWEMEYNDGNWAYFFLFFSYWSLIVEVLYLACATSLSWSYGTTGIHLESFNAITFKPLRAPDYVSPLLTCTWILQNIALPYESIVIWLTRLLINWNHSKVLQPLLVLHIGLHLIQRLISGVVQLKCTDGIFWSC
mmetsp:Transcript_30590/g.74533  ORF Transcript_30590/g.74533 Transcript_30590/m.74533 type:complete len:209 (+) Transcript_30590:58-684(+)